MAVATRLLPLSMVRSPDGGRRGLGVGRGKQIAAVSGRTSTSPTKSAEVLMEYIWLFSSTCFPSIFLGSSFHSSLAAPDPDWLANEIPHGWDMSYNFFCPNSSLFLDVRASAFRISSTPGIPQQWGLMNVRSFRSYIQRRFT